MCRGLDFIEKVQSLLDAGHSRNKVADMLNVHHSKIDRLLQRGLVEVHVAFDEYEHNEPAVKHVDWLYEDLLEKMCDEAEENFYVNIKSVLGDYYFDIGRYTLDKYGGIYGYLYSKKKMVLKDFIFKECTSCAVVINIQGFCKKKKDSFGMYSECNSCQNKRFKEYLKNNPEYMKVVLNRRRARKVSLQDDFTQEQMKSTFETFGGCALTGYPIDIHWDHTIPLATGHGGTFIGNMIPLRADLNLSKNDSNIFEWFEANRQRFELSQERFDSLIAWLASANAMTVEEYRDYVYWCHANQRTIDELEAQ